MAEYEMVREIPNLCRNNQMRDVFFEEIETDDPVAYVRSFLKGKAVELSWESRSDGGMTVYALCDGLAQKFIFTPI
jgi:DNA-directed RNA polymerase subunit H (RpoH/RPB5)